MNNNADNNKILIIDDEEQILKSIGELLQREKFSCITARSSSEGLALMKKERPLVVITDLKMENERSGIHVLEGAKEIDPEAVVILYTAHGDVSVTRDAFKKGVFDFIPKVVQTLAEQRKKPIMGEMESKEKTATSARK